MHCNIKGITLYSDKSYQLCGSQTVYKAVCRNIDIKTWLNNNMKFCTLRILNIKLSKIK